MRLYAVTGPPVAFLCGVAYHSLFCWLDKKRSRWLDRIRQT